MKLIATPQNLCHIAGMMKKLSINKTLTEVLTYPTFKKQNVMRRALGLSMKFPNKQTEQSRIWIAKDLHIEVDNMYDRKFIRVQCKEQDEAFIIYCGDTVTFKNGNMTVKTVHPTRSKHRAIQVINFI